MGVFGTILSIIPTVASIVGHLFNETNHNYVAYSLYGSGNKYPLMDGMVFFENENNRIILHNGCDYPIHVSVEKDGAVLPRVGNDVIIPYLSEKDITDLLSEHAVKNVDRIRISINLPEKESSSEVVSMKCKARLDRNIRTPVQIGEYLSVELSGDNLNLIAHSGCSILEIQSVRLSGDGNETYVLYENITPDDGNSKVNKILHKVTNEGATTMTINDILADFNYSDMITVDVGLLCTISDVKNESIKKSRESVLKEKNWDFLRYGKCLNKNLNFNL